MKTTFSLLITFISMTPVFCQTRIDSLFILKGPMYFLNEHVGLEKSDTSGRLIWYSNLLYGFGEPVLYNREGNDTVYRLVRFGCVIRIEKDANGCQLYVRNHAEERVKALSNQQWTRLTKKIKRSHYWQMKPLIDRNGKDGYNLILEGKVGEKYKVVDRWVPKRSRFRHLCTYIIELSEMEENSVN